ADAARAANRLELVAYSDGVLADLVLRTAPEAAPEACALAAESASENVATTATKGAPLARELVAQARLRQVRVSADQADRARHLEAGIELALVLDRKRAGARLGGFMFDLVEDAERAGTMPARGELERLASAIARLGDDELAEMARGVLAELA
ncbi:MAG TPA: hypothetical protein VFQ65_30510, partial [Kofleriaceae bacterium]|nr:hypothetical protein [Kofleriaceae bacterium]